MSFLSAGTLSSLRRVAAGTMQTPCTLLLHAPAARDSMGGTPAAWTTGPSTVCRVSVVRNQTVEVINQGRLEAVNRFTIALPLGTVLSARDRIQLADGSIFEVASVQSPRTYDPEFYVQAEMVVS